jgi:hypothetical protein
MDEQRMAEVRGRYEDWWERRNAAAVLSIVYPRRRQYDPALVRPWMSPPVVSEWSMWQQEFLFGQAAEIALRTGNLQPMDDAIEFLAGYPAVTGNAAEGYPFLNPTAGPGCLSALMTGFTRFQDTTIWLELDEPLALRKHSRRRQADLSGRRALRSRSAAAFVQEVSEARVPRAAGGARRSRGQCPGRSGTRASHVGGWASRVT